MGTCVGGVGGGGRGWGHAWEDRVGGGRRGRGHVWEELMEEEGGGVICLSMEVKIASCPY